MGLKRRIKKLTTKELVKVTGSKFVLCKECKDEVVLVSNDVKAVTCGYCVQRMLAPPDNYVKAKTTSTRPKGWNLKQYIELDGKVYVKGEEITDPTEIKKLRTKHKGSKRKVKKESL